MPLLKNLSFPGNVSKRNVLPSVVGIVDVQFGDLISFGPLDIRKRVGQLFFAVIGALFVEHGNLVGEIRSAALALVLRARLRHDDSTECGWETQGPI